MNVQAEKGQYLVEFSLAFAVFVIFVFFVIDIGLLIYNHNLFYRGVSEGARNAGLGRSNQQIRRTVSESVVDRSFPTMLMVANPDTLSIDPPREIHRVDGREVTLNMDTRFGMSLLWYGVLDLDLPIRSSAVVHRRNDRDRDGCKDELEDTGLECVSYQTFPAGSNFPRDHDNDGAVDRYIFDGPDTDADNDGTPWNEDYVIVAYTVEGGADTYAIYRPNDPFPPGCSSVTVDGNPNYSTCFNGRYHAPELWGGSDTDVVGKVESAPSIFPKSLPIWQVQNSGNIDFVKRQLWTEYDADNDGWEDKFDEHPYDPTRH